MSLIHKNLADLTIFNGQEINDGLLSSILPASGAKCSNCPFLHTSMAKHQTTAVAVPSPLNLREKLTATSVVVALGRIQQRLPGKTDLFVSVVLANQKGSFPTGIPTLPYLPWRGARSEIPGAILSS